MKNSVRRPIVAVVALAVAAALLLALPGVSPAAAADSVLTIVHGIPGTPVDVYSGGTSSADKVVADLQPATLASPLTVPSGPLALVVVATGGDPADPAQQIISQTIEVASGSNLSVVANLTGGTPNLAVFTNDLSPVAGGSARVTVRHTADAPPIDVLVNSLPGLSGLSQGFEASAAVVADTYDVQTQLTDGTPVAALSPGNVVVPAGKNVISYAIGSATDDTTPLALVRQVLDVPVTPTPTTPRKAPSATPANSVRSRPAFTG